MYVNNGLVLLPVLLSVLSDIIVGFRLSSIGGEEEEEEEEGSILAVPLLVYVIGVDTHIAIGTSALAVVVKALVNFFYKRGKGCIKI